MKDNIKSYIQTCNQYQRRGKTTDENELHSIKIKEPFYQWGIDIVGSLTETSRENKYIVIAIDYFKKYPKAKALTNTNAKSVANFIYEDIICRHGCPRKIISDKGTHFNNQVIEKLNEERENWDEYISLMLFAYRTKINKNTQFTSFYLTYGREAILPFDEDNKTEITLGERVEEISTKFTQTKKKALENIRAIK